MKEAVEGLKKVYVKVYLNYTRGGQEAEAIRYSSLVNQYIFGMLPELKVKVVRSKGSMDHLLTKTRFKEVSQREWEIPQSQITFDLHST